MAAFRRILVAVDGSDNAQAALERAVEWAKASRPEVIGLVHVRPTPETIAAAWGLQPMGYADLYDRILRDVQEESEKLLNAAEAFVREQLGDVAIARHAETGPVAPAIRGTVQRGGYDLLVMGSRGMGRAAGLLLGSVSQAILAAIPCAVLVVPLEKREK